MRYAAIVVLPLALLIGLALSHPPAASAGAGSPPVANGDAYSTTATLVVDAASGLLANDTDPDGGPLLASKQSDPASGTLTAFDSSGAFTYVPAPGYTGADSFTYLTTDAESNVSGIATVTIRVFGLVPVDPEDEFPVAGDDVYSTGADTPLMVPAPGVLANDTGPIGVALGAAVVSTTLNGTLALGANGSFTYSPSPGFAGTDTFIYTAIAWSLGSSSGDAIVTITVEPPPLVPTANDDAYTIAVDTVLTVSAPGILTNDSDPAGAPLVVASVTTTVNGWLTLGTDGSFEYVPAPGFIGTDAFDYAAVRLPLGDAGGAGNATVTITVTGPPSPSMAPSEDPSVTPSEDPSVTPSEDPSVTPSDEPSIAPSVPGRAAESERPVPSSLDGSVDGSDDPVAATVASTRGDDVTTTRSPAPAASRGGPTSLPNTGSGEAGIPPVSPVLVLLLGLMGAGLSALTLMIRRG